MKKVVMIAASLSIMVACNNKEKQAEELQRARQATIDSVNMANNHQRMLDSMTAVAGANQDAMVIETPTLQATPEPEPTPHKSGTKKTTRSTPATTSKEPTATSGTPSSPTSTTAAPSSTGNDPNATAGTGNGAGTGTTTAEEKKKKGLNNAAKGAIIGLGTGAAAGAVINKDNRGKGAVIGGVIGAVGGAVGGAVLDKRKAKKEQAAKDSTNK